MNKRGVKPSEHKADQLGLTQYSHRNARSGADVFHDWCVVGFKV